jgi:hypothetical protein
VSQDAAAKVGAQLFLDVGGRTASRDRAGYRAYAASGIPETRSRKPEMSTMPL